MNQTDDQHIILSLNLAPLDFCWLNSIFEPLQTVNVNGKTTSEIESELELGVRGFGLEPSSFSEKLHFEIPDYRFASNPFQEISHTALSDWRIYRGLANTACQITLDHLQIAGEIRIWPHHFDTGFYAQLKAGLGLGFGLAMEDGIGKSPYFYMSAYSDGGNLDFIYLPILNIGRWEVSEGWSGAILPISAIHNLDDKSMKASLFEFLKPTLNWYLHQ